MKDNIVVVLEEPKITSTKLKYYDLPAPRRTLSRQSLIVTNFGWTSVTLRDNLNNGIRSILRIFLTGKREIGLD